ncbi:MAG TPA: hypothetical protein VK139_01170 [Microbacteriaceae bacterium]|nr:hypothetical protein [Microbacteriaceae bacterium]
MNAGGASVLASTSTNSGAPGYTSLADIPGVDTTLWPATAASDAAAIDSTVGFAAGGDGYAVSDWSGQPFGAGGFGWTDATSSSTPGRPGLVVVRFSAYTPIAPVSPVRPSAGSLPHTGIDPLATGAIAVALILASEGIRRRGQRLAPAIPSGRR